MDPTGEQGVNIFFFLPQRTQVAIGNWANRAYDNNSVARYAMDHPYQTGATLGVLGGGVAAGAVVLSGGAITCGIICGSTVAKVALEGGGAALSTQVNKVTDLLDSAESTILNGTQRQAITQVISNQKLGNIFNALYKGSDSLPGGTAGAIKYTAETGKFVFGSDHIEKGIGYLRGLQNVLSSKGLSSSDREIAQTLANQLINALSSLNK